MTDAHRVASYFVYRDAPLLDTADVTRVFPSQSSADPAGMSAA